MVRQSDAGGQPFSQSMAQKELVFLAIRRIMSLSEIRQKATRGKLRPEHFLAGEKNQHSARLAVRGQKSRKFHRRAASVDRFKCSGTGKHLDIWR